MEAQDLTQGYFIRILEGRYLNRADANRGRFRSFLLHSCKFFFAEQAGRARGQKRRAGPYCPLRSPRATNGAVLNHSITKRQNVSSNGMRPLCGWTGHLAPQATSLRSMAASVTSRSSRYSVRTQFPTGISRARRVPSKGALSSNVAIHSFRRRYRLPFERTQIGVR
jgi:hypothetical protein